MWFISLKWIQNKLAGKIEIENARKIIARFLLGSKSKILCSRTDRNRMFEMLTRKLKSKLDSYKSFQIA